MAQKTKTNAWTDEEKASIRQLLRYAAWIMAAIVVALIVAAVLSAVFNPETDAGTATNTDLMGTPVVTPLPN